MSEATPDRVKTNVAGLDGVLCGGLVPGRSYLVTGGPGTGKTTLGLHFLSASPARETLLISLGEAERHLRRDAASIGLDLDGIPVLDLSPSGARDDTPSYTLLEPWEAEAPDIRARIEAMFPDGPPARVFIDALSQLFHLVPDAYQFRKQVMILLEYLTRAGSTVIYTAEQGSGADDALQYLGDGIVHLERRDSTRTLRVLKFRGSGFAEGEHTVKLGARGMQVFEQLVPDAHAREAANDVIPSGIEALDRLVGGGIESGTVTIISGPTGVGKTSLGMRFLWAAARRGTRARIFTFEESEATLRRRCEATDVPLAALSEQGLLGIEAVEPLRYAPAEFAWRVRQEVEQHRTRIVMIDSLAGFRQAISGDDLSVHAHALCRYLGNMGVTVLLVNEQATIAGGEFRVSDHGISYLADTILLLRYLEVDSELRKAIGVLKKRTSDFEKTLREFDITPEGLSVGPPLQGLQGILSGVPTAHSRA